MRRVIGFIPSLLAMAAAAFLLGPTPTRADYIVTAKMTGVGEPTNVSYKLGSGSWTGTLAGNYLWDASGTGTAILGDELSTFCIEVRQNIQIGGTYTYKLTSNIESLPQNTMGAGMGAEKAKQLAYLANAYKSNAYAGWLSASMAPGVIQAAIWNLINDTDFNTMWGNLRVQDNNGGNDNFEQKVNDVLNDVKGKWELWNASSADYYLIGLTNNTYQDQIVIVNKETYMLFAAPAPAGLVLGGIGLVLGGGYVLLRKRRTAAATLPVAV